jgi:codanin-1
VKRVLIRALDGSKLLVTIPWLVEYLAMLDFITIRLDYYRELFQILYSIYTRVNVVEKDRGSLCVLATSNFIIRACLGWLFEHSDIPEDYHSVSNMKHALKSLHQQQDSNERNTNETIDILRLHPLLENVLTAACPFLADLRIAMMPQRVTKVLSRTGRFRHITTKFQDKKQVEAKTQDGRAALVEAFLASQTPSVRKTVDFVIERTTSAVVKDFQVKYLIKIRKDAKTEVEKFAETVENVQKLTKEMTKIFSEFLIKLHDKWNIEVNENCRKRICGAFDSLMPFEMHTEVKNRLVGITYERTMSKVEEWRITNISTIVIFSKDIVSEATKLFIEKKHNQNNEMIKLNSNLIIDLSATSVLPSELFKKLQKILHESSLKKCESLRMEEVMEVFDMAVEIVEKQGLPSSAIRNISYFLLQLLILLIFNKSHFATRELKAKFFELCKNEKTSPFTNVSAAKSGDFIFSHLITPRLFITYQGRSRMSFEHYADFLIEIAKENFIVIDQLIEQSVQLYQYEWNNENLNEIAFFVERLKSSLPSHGTPAESQLFIELVADLARDMENF